MVRVGELVPGHRERAGTGELDLGRRGRARASLTGNQQRAFRASSNPGISHQFSRE
jgi:hypothetical protein